MQGDMYTLARGTSNRRTRIAKHFNSIMIAAGIIGLIAIAPWLLLPYRSESVLTWILLNLTGGLPVAGQ